MPKPTSDDEVAGMIRQAARYFELLERQWIEAPDYASGVTRVKLSFENGHGCMRIALKQAKQFEAEEKGERDG
jgi:hypothetical protein